MKAIILTNDRKVKEKKVNPSKLWFYYRAKLYDLDPTAIVMKERASGETIARPTLLYFENSSEPIRYSDAPTIDPTASYFEKYVKLNSVRVQHKPSFFARILPGLQTFAGLFTISNFVILIITLSMLYSFLEGGGII